MFRSCNNSGFQIRFENGYVISCQFSTFNYCSRRDFKGEYGAERKESLVNSEDCEIAIIKNGEFITAEILDRMGLDISNDGDVAGWVSADNVGKIIGYLVGLEG